MDDFDSPKSLADYLYFLIQNTDEYMKYFYWRKSWAVVPINTNGYLNGRLSEINLNNKIF